MPSFEFECEYAKSARATCKHCKERIEKGALRLGLKILATAEADADTAARQQAHAAESTRWHHTDCFPQIRGAAWFRKHLPEEAKAIAGFPGLEEPDRERVLLLLEACRGAVGGTPCKTAGPGRKRKADTDAEANKENIPPEKLAREDAVGVLTEAQFREWQGVRAETARLSAAVLGAQLARNGLPKTGRKEELLERVAECCVLGVPPACPACSKAKLKWSRMTGLFSCPGYFDDEDMRFKRCKGPDANCVIVRTPWQELVA